MTIDGGNTEAPARCGGTHDGMAVDDGNADAPARSGGTDSQHVLMWFCVYPIYFALIFAILCQCSCGGLQLVLPIFDPGM